MTKILIPSPLIELTGFVQQCLLLAKEQGFSTEEIELGVSPTHLIQLVPDQNKTVCVGTDLVDGFYEASSGDFTLYYQSDLPLKETNQQSSSSIFIGIEEAPPAPSRDDNMTVFDIWRHPISDEVRALSVHVSASKNFQAEYHLAWIVTLLALDFPIEDALTLARAMTNVSRETQFSGETCTLHEWASHIVDFPTPVIEDVRLGIQVGWSSQSEAVGFPCLDKDSLGLYPVVDDVSWIERLLPLGIKTIQLRIKDAVQSDLEQQIIRAIELGRQYDAQVFINDYWQLAIKHGAFGVHLGQEDIEASNLLHLSEAGIHLGLSTHGYYELLRIVQINPSYIALGHIFPTTTKQMPSKPQGLIRLALYQTLIDSIPYGKQVGYPTVAIGGIDQSNAEQVWRCGVSSLAVVRAMTLSESPKSVIEFFNQLMGSVQPLQEVEGESAY
ncbi:Condenses 4-methyl-5-(beta-hydroxyethyl)thiazole monophosphate (THZ-P) and 2-methyl-4-amino-5-hydroxymethyl pyrimidine pyrophosphate (HMP-PP) to form thiamine monophosphate (TMP) [Vibrio sp. B1FLJ16]|uniref:thiamine phosphate synthase n=1 Tax=Vibrio sp. B1FLJ16 TaxID=2751178 RepID=UPI0015F5DC88|nr:thiamine phosphate synthase [Vibrio sp. B1FLJ16]CAD7814024.1 Condenses 4-methyl-5-(beta-hydroxyethyl)thiazole monophosphate (THZ-P) and 2-methyl-4-amino-5-hydroxymethyl pyrimidine pyrophosphate (HMP-PP) to form thiamine monophosphate (TMP) [Vibrio sp. B1FLJ16]CAE6921661.1 Condenses 4-methyl-5-(beta-hydroxyethyl)thiazole monophosphate (THZ-P) and 2-methyl-4-amino-5-hydroxymethyl pyrimidine pyrophosphate (HMP-PP) to form thiamine monophosphate (TMP) [Vibrio sp. B1FLJ16]